MSMRFSVSLLLIANLAFLPPAAAPQVPINSKEMSVKVLGILDWEGTRLGTLLVAGRSNRGYLAGNEYWLLDREAVLGITDQQGLEFTTLAAGEWTDPWVAEALDWHPEGSSVWWSHPAEVEWTAQDEMLPPIVPGGAYFGHSTLGGLTIQYTERGPASLTWFKLTEGDFMQLEDGATFTRDDEPPSTGSWWHGPIESRR